MSLAIKIALYSSKLDGSFELLCRFGKSLARTWITVLSSTSGSYRLKLRNIRNKCVSKYIFLVLIFTGVGLQLTNLICLWQESWTTLVVITDHYHRNSVLVHTIPPGVRDLSPDCTPILIFSIPALLKKQSCWAGFQSRRFPLLNLLK